MTEQTRPDPLASTQKPWRPDDVYCCRHERILNLGTYGECASCYQRFDPADLESSQWPTTLAFSPDEQADTGDLIPGYEAEAWDEPLAHAWKTLITFRGMVLTVYTGSVSGRTREEVRAYLQLEYRAAEIGTPEVAR